MRRSLDPLVESDGMMLDKRSPGPTSPAPRAPRGPVLVTGANGFVGRALIRRLLADGRTVRAAVRRSLPPGASLPCPVSIVGEIGPETAWADALGGVDAVVHLAAAVHRFHAAAGEADREYRRVNVDGTRALAEACAQSGVRRFVLVSTVKVHGESTHGHPVTEADPPAPEDPYGISKWEAEQALKQIAQDAGMESVVLRPPLIYGPGVRANFHALVEAVRRGVPLPLGAVQNRRSIVFVENFVDAVDRCLDCEQAAGETFLVDDGAPVSTSALIRALAESMGRSARLLPVPPAWLRTLGRLTGRSATVDRLLSDLEVDSSKLRRLCGWTPPFDLSAGLRETVAETSYAATASRATKSS